MATKKQRAANRRNAKALHGPEDTRRKSHLCSLNSLRDGLYATTLLLPTEDKDKFNNIIAKYEVLYQPDGTYEEELVELLAGAKWRMMRAALLEKGVLMQYGDELRGRAL